MVFTTIPATSVDTGSPLDETLMSTIKVDLDDLDGRVTTNTTAIAAIGGGGGSGGGYNNILYFDAPGSWTSPATISKGKIMVTGASGGGGGSGFNGAPPAGGSGGTSTSTVAMTYTYPGVAGGAAAAAYAVGNPGGNNILTNSGVSERVSFNNGLIESMLVAGGSVASMAYTENHAILGGGSGGYSVVSAGGLVSGRGGANRSNNSEYTFSVNTVYPITIGQAGAGGAGGGWPSGVGGSGGGPGGGGGSGGSGGAGGLVPHSFVGSAGNPGAIGGPAGGSGGGTGVHGSLYIYY